MSIKCFVATSAGFRALSSIFQTVQQWISGIATPAYTTIRQWVLKIGLYKLSRPKTTSPRGWFLIIDTSIQMGAQKCVVVLGIRKSDINKNFSPTLEQAEPFIVRPLYTCPGEVISEILEEAAQIAGSDPIAVISDAGSELKRGMRIFTQNHRHTIHLFDVSHKINTCLKEELSSDKIWASFKSSAANAIQHLKLSSLAYLVPPRQRTKERMHSAFLLIEWGLRVLYFLDSEACRLTKEERNRIEWLEEYRFSLPCYIYFEKLCKYALELVHKKGYYQGLGNDFVNATKYLCTGDKKVARFQIKLKETLEEEEFKVPKEEQYLGSSEVIESLFGKFKAVEGHHSSSGLTSLVLAIPALVGKLDESIVSAGLREVSIHDVEQWIRVNMDQTFLSQRRKALAIESTSNTQINLELCD
jgi:hypothetical protein